ncbi:motility associated factor glycosyltransferase family protein [Marinimicrobium locisalis]|uniref:motility associated factor glycosyltransferase family protein n=1 Tax=Marinimicrobium locisalis TaxID=546022 RepID=UPI0032216247
MSNDLNQLIRQTELHQQQLMLSQRFEKNLRFLSSAAPDLYDEYKNYAPQSLKLSFTESGHLDLINLGTGKFVYGAPPEELHQKAVEDFLKSPRRYATGFSTIKKSLLELEPFIRRSNTAIEYFNSQLPRFNSAENPERIKLLVVAGVGMGQHIPLLLEKVDVRHLFIIEPDKDLFFCSLHTLDWEETAQHFAKEGYSLNLQVGQEPSAAINALQVHLENIGPYNAVTTYLFDFLQTERTSESTRLLLKQLSRSLAVQGYFDDERVGLAHTINNVKNNIPCLTQHSKISGKKEPLPAFVIGNGPSLDAAESFLRENKDKAILISCGTTLGSLAHMGITPDFHIEQERLLMISEFLSSSTTEEFRKDIRLVGLNTVHPEVFRLFDQKVMFMKPNDLGSTYSQKLIKRGHSVVQLPNCNPTVTNAGAALAIALGFKEVYLVGVDYGSPDTQSHHSKRSTYYRFKKQYNETLSKTLHSQSNTPVQGNFGGEVLTSRTLNLSRVNMEELIEKSPGHHFYNTSNGALIHGATPLRYNDASIDAPTTPTPQVADRLLQDCFSTEPFESAALSKRIEADFKPAEKILTKIITVLDRKPESHSAANDIVDRIHNVMQSAAKNTVEDRANQMLLKGSINTFNLLLQATLDKGGNSAKAMTVFEVVASEYKSYLYEALEQLRKGFLDNDQRRANIGEALEG